MRKKFDEIAALGERHFNATKDSKEPQTIGRHLQKFAEEFGELSQGINKLTGLKSLKKNETMKDVKLNIREEGADCIQLIFILVKMAGFEYADLKKELGKKNGSYESFIKKLEKKNKKKK